MTNEKIERLKSEILKNSDSRKVSEQRAEELASRYHHYHQRTKESDLWQSSVDDVLAEISQVCDTDISSLAAYDGISPKDIAQL